jgi:hypothetical protein
MNISLPLLALIVLQSLLAPVLAADLPAFPGAEGFGAGAVGGRGGRVIEVTNLNDSGPGSLRSAVESSGPRIVVFRVGGTIPLKTELILSQSHITIAGQTAPGGGITLTTIPSNPRSVLTVKGGARDVVLRYLRFRPAPPTRREQPGDDSHIQDALQILDASQVIVDHCSMSWATDEVVSTFSSAENVTIQWCIIAEGLRNTNRGGVDGKGLLVGGPRARRLSVHHNLLANNLGRNPMVKAAGIVDVVNNVVLAPATTAMTVDGEYGETPVNFVGNFVMAPQGDGIVHGLRVLGKKPVSLFVKDNFGPLRTKDSQPETLFVDPGNRSREYTTRVRHEAPAVTTMSATEALQRVVDEAGCTLPVRDAVDLRIVTDVRDRRGRLINDPLEVGGWPHLPIGMAPADSDHDGMTDEWEREHQFNSNDAADGATDADSDGYTNVEEYLNGTDPCQQ